MVKLSSGQWDGKTLVTWSKVLLKLIGAKNKQILDIQMCNNISGIEGSNNQVLQDTENYKNSWNTSRDICLVLSFMSFLGTFIILNLIWRLEVRLVSTSVC